jgi:hypothetical protein
MAAVSSSARSRSRSRTNHRQGEASSADKLVEAIIHLLEAGTTPWRRQWDASGGGHHVNLLSGHRYQGANPILLTLGMHLRGSALPYWCGFAEAKALGIFPRKGSQGVRILRPQVNRVAGVEGSDSSDRSDTPGGTPGIKPDDAPTDRVWMSFRPVVVFNAIDLEGDALAGWVPSPCLWNAQCIQLLKLPTTLLLLSSNINTFFLSHVLCLTRFLKRKSVCHSGSYSNKLLVSSLPF